MKHNYKYYCKDYENIENYEAAKGMHWYNNNITEKLCYECPDGFIPGRIKKLWAINPELKKYLIT